jgi:hypothetical protein
VPIGDALRGKPELQHPVAASLGRRQDHAGCRGDHHRHVQTSSLETGGITTDGTKLYVEAIGQIYSVDVSGSTPVLSSPLAGENDNNWSEQSDLDFASGYDPTATQTAASVELLSLDSTQTLGVDSYLSRDSTGNLYFTAVSADDYVEKLAACP